MVSQVNNHHACSTVAFYLCMFVMQLLPFIYSLTSILLQEQTMSFHLSQQWSIQHVTLLVLLMLPQCINPVVCILRNDVVKNALFRLNKSRCRRHFKKGRCRRHLGGERLGRGDRLGGGECSGRVENSGGKERCLWEREENHRGMAWGWMKAGKCNRTPLSLHFSLPQIEV